MKQIFFDKVKNLIIEDVTGKKNIANVKKEFGEADYQVIKIANNDGYKIKSGKIEKVLHSIVQANEEVSAEKEAKIQTEIRELAIASLKIKNKL